MTKAKTTKNSLTMSARRQMEKEVKNTVKQLRKQRDKVCKALLRVYYALAAIAFETINNRMGTSFDRLRDKLHDAANDVDNMAFDVGDVLYTLNDLKGAK